MEELWVREASTEGGGHEAQGWRALAWGLNLDVISVISPATVIKKKKKVQSLRGGKKINLKRNEIKQNPAFGVSGIPLYLSFLSC